MRCIGTSRRHRGDKLRDKPLRLRLPTTFLLTTSERGSRIRDRSWRSRRSDRKRSRVGQGRGSLGSSLLWVPKSTLAVRGVENKIKDSFYCPGPFRATHIHTLTWRTDGRPLCQSLSLLFFLLVHDGQLCVEPRDRRCCWVSTCFIGAACLTFRMLWGALEIWWRGRGRYYWVVRMKCLLCKWAPLGVRFWTRVTLGNCWKWFQEDGAQVSGIDDFSVLMEKTKLNSCGEGLARFQIWWFSKKSHSICGPNKNSKYEIE